MGYKVTATKSGRTVTVDINYLPEVPTQFDLDKEFTADQNLANILKSLDITYQSRIRNLIVANEDDVVIQSSLANYKPGMIVRVTGNPVEREIAKAKASLVKQFGCSFDDLPVSMQDLIIAKATERGEAIIAKNAQEDEQDVDVDVNEEAGE